MIIVARIAMAVAFLACGGGLFLLLQLGRELGPRWEREGKTGVIEQAKIAIVSITFGGICAVVIGALVYAVGKIFE